MTPDFRIDVASFNPNATALVKRRLFHVAVSQNVRDSADRFEIRLSDVNRQLILPPVGDEIGIALGYRETGLMEMGTYTVDEVGLQGPPDSLTFSGSTDKTGAGMNSVFSRSWDNVTLITVLQSIAERHANTTGQTLNATADAPLADVFFVHLDQINETDTAFLLRLAKRVGGFYNSDGHTIGIYQEDQGTRHAAVPVSDPILLSLHDISQWQLYLPNKSDYDYVRVWSVNPDRSADQPTHLETYYPDYTPPGDGLDAGLSPVRVYTVAAIAPDTDTARTVAEQKLRDLAHQSRQLSITLPGNAALVAGARVRFADARPELAEPVWILNDVSHRLDSGGYTTEGYLWQPLEDG